jgi:hypothetical protein
MTGVGDVGVSRFGSIAVLGLLMGAFLRAAFGLGAPMWTAFAVGLVIALAVADEVFPRAVTRLLARLYVRLRKTGEREWYVSPSEAQRKRYLAAVEELTDYAVHDAVSNLQAVDTVRRIAAIEVLERLWFAAAAVSALTDLAGDASQPEEVRRRSSEAIREVEEKIEDVRKVAHVSQ